jgi:hypothetical protein
MGMAVAVCLSIDGLGPVHAQSNELGSYQGTISITGTEIDPAVSYSAKIKITLPVTDRDDDSINAEFYSGEAPDATVSITQWNESHTEKSVGTDGKYASYKCELAAPKDIPMMPTGVLDVDLEQSVHMLSLTLLGSVEIDLNCVHSQSGAYKRTKGVALYVGTGTAGMQYEHPIPFTDAAHLAAKYTLVPDPNQTNSGPIMQEWDLRLTE